MVNKERTPLISLISLLSGADKDRTVLDLPQMYAKPLATEILEALELLKMKPRSFGLNSQETQRRRAAQSDGISQYLTTIISSSLSWLESDDARETVWDVAAARLSERSGRAGRRDLWFIRRGFFWFADVSLLLHPY